MPTTIDPSKRRYLITLRNSGELTPAEQHELEMADAAYGERWWMSVSEVQWFANADETARFHLAHQRWPSSSAEDSVERKLGGWLSNQRGGERTGSNGWTIERGAYLDEAAPGWRGEDPQKQWESIADSVGRFNHEHHRWPSQTGHEPTERRLGKWLSNQRSNERTGSNRWTAERTACLDAVAAGWRGDDPQTQWESIADSVGRFNHEHHRWPSGRASNPNERRLGVWLSSQRANERTNSSAWTAERGTYLDVVADGWRGKGAPKPWESLADDVAQFYHEYRRWPYARATSPTEQRLGQWLRNQRTAERKRSKGWTAERGTYLDKVAAGWRGEDRQTQRQSTADEVGRFHREQQRWPSSTANDMAERHLAQWLSQQRRNERLGSNGWTTERGAYLDRVAPGWRNNQQSQWASFADDVGGFYREHQRWPSSSAKAPGERRIGRWLTKQRVSERADSSWWSADRSAYLDKVAAGWRGQSLQKQWESIASDIGRFHREHQRWPSSSAKIAVERRLGYWLVQQRRNERRTPSWWTVERGFYLDRVAPGWRGPNAASTKP